MLQLSKGVNHARSPRVSTSMMMTIIGKEYGGALAINTSPLGNVTIPLWIHLFWAVLQINCRRDENFQYWQASVAACRVNRLLLFFFF